MVSDEAAFVHTAYLESSKLTDRNNKKAWKNDCFGMALSIHATAISGKPPIAMNERLTRMLSHSSLPEHNSDGAVGAPDCLRDWIEGHDLLELPEETMSFVGVVNGKSGRS